MQYSNIAARVVRRALKPELQADAAKREVSAIKFKKWINGKPEGKISIAFCYYYHFVLSVVGERAQALEDLELCHAP